MNIIFILMVWVIFMLGHYLQKRQARIGRISELISDEEIQSKETSDGEKIVKVEMVRVEAKPAEWSR